MNDTPALQCVRLGDVIEACPEMRKWRDDEGLFVDADMSLPVPVLPRIDSAVLAAVEAPGNKLNMGEWHTCGTTHCRAGWAIHLAGAEGYALEGEVGAWNAGAAIYAASRPGQALPDFFGVTSDVLASLRADAAREEASA
jgi:hypothetical protein